MAPSRPREQRPEEDGGRPAGTAARKAMAPSRPREPRPEEEGGRPAGTGARRAMVSFVGRVLFASIFLLSAYQDASQFGSDGGPAIKFLEPKFNLFVKQVSTNIGIAVPHVQIQTVFFTTFFLRVFGAIMLIHYSSFGAFLLILYLAFITPVMYGFDNYEMESPQYVQLFTQLSQNLALFGALLFFMGMKSSVRRRLQRMQNSIPRRHSKRVPKTRTT